MLEQLVRNRALIALVDRLGGEVTILVDELEDRGISLATFVPPGGNRIVLRAITSERAKAYARDGVYVEGT